MPEHLLYDIENQIWYEPLDDGTIRVGFTKWAAKLMGEILSSRPNAWDLISSPTDHSVSWKAANGQARRVPPLTASSSATMNASWFRNLALRSTASQMVGFFWELACSAFLLCERNPKNGPPRLKPRWWAENFTDSKLCDQPLVPHG
jgi:hypothetical protein